MKYRLKIGVSLKPGHSDPEGETTAKLLRELGYDVGAASVSKCYGVALEAASRSEAMQKAEEMCRRLLANPTKDDYVITVEEEK
jgi:phosphoribosylformylglycinamidine synthase PurS subunit